MASASPSRVASATPLNDTLLASGSPRVATGEGGWWVSAGGLAVLAALALLALALLLLLAYLARRRHLQARGRQAAHYTPRANAMQHRARSHVAQVLRHMGANRGGGATRGPAMQRAASLEPEQVSVTGVDGIEGELALPMAVGPVTGSVGAAAVFLHHGRPASHLPAAFNRLGVVSQPGDRPAATAAEKPGRAAASGTCLRPVMGGVLSGAVGLGGDAEETASTSAASHQGDRRGRLLLDETEAFRPDGKPGPVSEEALQRRAFEAHRRFRDMRGMPSSTGSTGSSGSALAGGSQRSSRSDGSGHTVLHLLPSLESRVSRSSRASRGDGTARRSGAFPVRINVLPTPRTPVAALASARRSGAGVGEDQTGAASGDSLFPARRPSRRHSPSDLRRPAGVGKKWLGGAGMTREEEAGAAASDLASKPRASTAAGALRLLLGLRVGAPLAVRRPIEVVGGAPVQQDMGSTSVTLPPSTSSGHIDSTSSPDRFAALEPSLSPPSRRLPRIPSLDARRGFGSYGLRHKAPGKPAAAELSGSAQDPDGATDEGHTHAQADTGSAHPSGGDTRSTAANAHAASETPRAGAKLPVGSVSAQRGGQLGRALPSQHRLRAGLPASPLRRLPGGITLTLQPVGSPRQGPDSPPHASPRLRHVEVGGAQPSTKADNSRSEAAMRRVEGSVEETQPAEPPLLPLRRGAKVMRFAADDSPSLLYAGNGLRVGGPPRGSAVSTASSAGGTARRFSLLTSLGHLLHLPAGATPASAVAARLARSTRDLQADYGLAAFAPTRVRVLLAVPAGEGGSPSDGEGEGADSDVASEAQHRGSRAAEEGGSIASGRGSACRSDRDGAAAGQDLTALSLSAAGAVPAVRAAGSQGSISHRSGGSVSRPVVPPLAGLARKGVSFASRVGAAGADSARSSVVVVLRGWTPRDSPRSPRQRHASRAATSARHTVVSTAAGAEGVSKPASEGFLRSALRAIGRWLPGSEAPDAPVQEPGASAQPDAAQPSAAAARSSSALAPAERSLSRRTPALSGEGAEPRAVPKPGEQGRHTRASHAYPLLANPLHSRTAAAHRAARGGAAAGRTRLRASGGRDAMGAAAATVSTAVPRPSLDVPSHPAPRATASVPGSPARLSGTRQRLEGSAAVAAAAAAALRPSRRSEERHGRGRASGSAPTRREFPDDLGGGSRPSLSAPLRSVQRTDAWVGDTPRSPAFTSRLAAASPTLQRPSHAQPHGVRGFAAAGADAAALRSPTLGAAPAAPAVEVLPRARLSARAAAAALRLHQWHGRGELRAGEEFAGVNPMQARALRLPQPEAAAEGGTDSGLVSSPPRRASVTHWLLRAGATPQPEHGVRASERRLSLTGTHKRSLSGPMHAPGAADATPRARASSAASGRIRVVLAGTIPRLREGERGTQREGERQSPGQASPSTAQRQPGWRDEPSTRAPGSPVPGLVGRRRSVGSERSADAFTAAPAARRASLPSPSAPHRSSSSGTRSAARPLLSAVRRLGAPTATPPASAAPPPSLSSLPASFAAALRDGALGLGASSRRLEGAAGAAAAHAGGPEGALSHAKAAITVDAAGATRERWDADGSRAAAKQLQLPGAPAARGSAGPLNTAGGSGDRGGVPALDVARRIRDVADISMSGSPKAEVAGRRVDAGT